MTNNLQGRWQGTWLSDVNQHTGALRCVVTQQGDGARQGAEILVPFVAPLVPEVDVAAGRLVIDPPPGLLDPDSAV